jgi:S1-C subfamily serine protease
MLFLASLVVGVVLGLFVSVGLQRALSPEPQAPAQGAADPATAAAQRSPDGSSGLDAEERHTIELFKEASRSVAFITTQVERVDYWSRNVFEVPAGSGSGFLWDDKGHVVTNFHVVQNSDSQKVALGAATFEAETVGTARDQDLAVLRIKAPGQKLVPIKLGTSSGLSVGQKVYAIGNPFGFDYSLTQGIVSALGRTIQSPSSATIFDVIQTDAAINMGNSGGPLLDSSGRLIGVNTAIFSPSGASAGIGFAVPVDTVARIVPELIAHGRVTRPVLGVGFDAQLSAVVTQRLGVEGVLIREVYEGTGAAAAGLVGTEADRRGRVIPGDVIQEIDGKQVRSTSDLLGRLGGYKPGDTVTLTAWRDGKTRKVQVRLGAPSER